MRACERARKLMLVCDRTQTWHQIKSPQIDKKSGCNYVTLGGLHPGVSIS